MRIFKEQFNWVNDRQQVVTNPIKRFEIRQQITDSLNMGLAPLLNETAQVIHEGNKRRGFYIVKRNLAEMLMLVVCEVSEAVEAIREGKQADLEAYEQAAASGFNKEAFQTFIKDSEEDEIADAVIRLLDYCAYRKIDIQRHINLKTEYNETRQHKHGKNF